MRTKKILYNSIFSTLLQILTMVTGLILPRVYLTVYGSEMNGLLTSITQVISYFNLVEAGLGASLIYSLYRPLAIKDYEAINSIISTGKKYYIKTSFVYMALVILLSLIYPSFINDNNISSTTILLLVLVIGLSGALEFFTMAKYRVLLTADQKLYIISIASIISTIINFFILLILSYMRVDIVILRIAALSALFIRSLIFKYYIKIKYPNINYNSNVIKLKKSLRGNALIFQFAISAHMSIPIVLITFFCTLIDVSIYSIYNMIFVSLTGILNIVTTGASSALGDIIANRKEGQLQKVFNEYELVIYSLIAWIYGCTLVLIIPFIKVYTLNITNVNYVNYTYGILFTIWGICNTAWMTRASLISANGLFKEVRNSSILQIVSLIVIGGILTKFYGIIGVLISLIIVSIYRVINTIYITNKYVLHEGVCITIKRLLLLGISIIINIIPFSKLININLTSLIDWGIYSVIIAIWNLIVIIILLYIFERNTLKLLFKRIRMLIR